MRVLRRACSTSAGCAVARDEVGDQARGLGVLHEAPHPDPTLRRQTLGKKRLLRSRGWSEDDWAQSVASLQERRLLDESGSMSADGAALYDRMEAQTDAAAATFWAHVPEAEAILQAARPFVKAVIDVGYLPGTRRKD